MTILPRNIHPSSTLRDAPGAPSSAQLGQGLAQTMAQQEARAMSGQAQTINGVLEGAKAQEMTLDSQKAQAAAFLQQAKSGLQRMAGVDEGKRLMAPYTEATPEQMLALIGMTGR